jgi:alkylation response protein AidB-like acyl-CoA dehydrogenase
VAEEEVEHARRIAADVLRPAAAEVDRTGSIPASHFAVLAAHGLYAPERPRPVAEQLASGCLSTAFVWLQHLGAVAATVQLPALHEKLATGQWRAGVAQAALRPGPPSVRAHATPQGYRLSGTAPWVTGWRYIDVLRVAARTADGMLVWALVHAVASDTLSVVPMTLSAVNAADTVQLTLTDHLVPADRVLSCRPFHPGEDPQVLRLNGFLALGLIRRCVELTGSAALAAQLEQARIALDTGEDVPRARARASALAVRAAAAAMAAAGAAAMRPGHDAGRLLREAGFLLVFGSRPAIRQALLEELDGIE